MRLIKILLVLVVLAAIVAGIFAWTLPADVGYRYGSKYLGPLVLSGVRGTIWDGHADGVSLFGNDLGELDWRARKQPLLHGEFVTDIRIKGAEVDIAGLLTRRSDGAVVAEGLRFSLPAARLEPMFENGNVKLLGTISGVLDNATWWTASLSDAKGTARWSGAGVTGDVDARFTDVLTEFASQPDGSLAGTVRDDGQGNVALDGRYTMHLPNVDGEVNLTARNGDAQAAEMLRHIGEPQADGSTRVVVHGRALRVL
jgi:hypothetical protein